MIQARIGVDLGGTKIEAVVVGVTSSHEPASPNVLARARTATARALGYDHILGATRDLVAEVARQAGIDPTKAPVGVGMPGSITNRRADGSRSEQALVKNSNTTCLNGMPFHADLASAIGRPVTFANDANCFALAEATWGAALGARVTFGVIMGTGVGGGLVITHREPRIWNGAQGIAGEWGHVALEPERGPVCYCGRRGCIETYLSGPAIEAEYALRAGSARGLADIAVRAAAGHDAIGRALLMERVELFGRAIAIVINVVDPDVIVIGGGVSNLSVLYDEGREAVRRWIFSDDVQTKIVKHALGDSAGVLGAALLL